MPSKFGLSTFYKSKAWRQLSAAYMSSQAYLCERCGAPATICHHRIWLNSDNVHNTDISLNMDNLEALCMACHNKEHGGRNYFRRNWASKNGTRFNDSGELVKDTNVFIVCGAPASGKSSYVKEHKQEGDLVFDMDMICSALIGDPEIYYSDFMPVLDLALTFRDATIEHVEKRLGYWGRAWIITSNPNKAYWQYLARRLKGEIIEMQTTEAECLRRVEADDRRKNKRLFNDLIHKWYATFSSVVSSKEGVTNGKKEEL